jgi:hypothetical protein
MRGDQKSEGFSRGFDFGPGARRAIGRPSLRSRSRTMRAKRDMPALMKKRRVEIFVKVSQT